METGLQILLTCPHVAGFLSANDYLRFEIALSGYFSQQRNNEDDIEDNNEILNSTNYNFSQLNSKLINDACRLAFRCAFFENVNSTKYHLLDHFLKPMIGETYKHLWFYINFIDQLNNKHFIHQQRITMFEIYTLICFHFLELNEEYILHLLNINEYESKLNDIVYILKQFQSKLMKIQSHCESSLNQLQINNIHVIYRQYSVVHLLSILGDYCSASISINKIREKCKRLCSESNCEENKCLKELYVFLLYIGCDTNVECLYSNTFVSNKANEADMMISGIQFADKGIAQQTQWMNNNKQINKTDITQTQNHIINNLVNEYSICKQQFLISKLCVTKSRAQSLSAQSAGLYMMPFKFRKQLNGTYLTLFNETENILIDTISDLHKLYQNLSDKLRYIDHKMSFLTCRKNNNSQDMLINNFNSIKSVIKNNNILSETVDKIKRFVAQNDENKQSSMQNVENKEEDIKAVQYDNIKLNKKDVEILYEMRFKIEKLMSDISILLIECDAVYGELFYCASSVNWRVKEKILNKTLLQLTDESILKTVGALKMFLDHYYSDDKCKDVSLLLLIRMLKDLGKVCGFKRSCFMSQKLQKSADLILHTLSQSAQYLEFANVICQNLNGKNHVLSKNIARLGHR